MNCVKSVFAKENKLYYAVEAAKTWPTQKINRTWEVAKQKKEDIKSGKLSNFMDY